MKKESTISMMYRGVISMMAFGAMLLVSCSSDSDFGGNGDNGNAEDGLTAIANSKTSFVIGSRSSLSYNSSGKGSMKFSWDANDKLSVFAADNYQAKQIYRINTSAEYGNSAHFSSKDFKLTEGKRYFSISKDENNGSGGPGTKIPDMRNIIVDYSGQKQVGNGSPAHLGNYDFMAASAVCEKEDLLHFDFLHLGATLRIFAMQKDGDTEFPNVRFNKLELYTSDNSFRQPLRNFNLEAGLQPDDTYVPAVAEPDELSTQRFEIDLVDKDDATKGIKPSSLFNDGTTNTYGDLLTYIEVPPFSLSNKVFGFVLHGKNSSDEEVTYYGTYNDDDYLTSGNNIGSIKSGYKYDIYFWAEKTTDFTVTLKLNHRWQHGDPELTSKATGDPGYDKEFGLPTHVYLFFCADGKVKQVNSYTDGTWNTVGDISTYSKTTTFTTLNDITDMNSLRVYAIASPNLISHSIHANGTPSTEDEVKALTYNYSSQTQMRDMYSTPWEKDATFVGNLKDPMQDIFLYHTAAKVDLTWNSTASMSGNVSVNNFQSAKLSVFMPTQNGTEIMKDEVKVADFTSATTNNVETPITTGTMYNGRQVYYLPQFSNNTYNVSIGSSKTYPSYKFNDVSTEGGFTSWYRALIKQ